MKSLRLLPNLTYVRMALAALLLGGLATPISAFADPTSTGSLQVFSSTREVQWGDGAYYYPHTGYRLIAPNGAVTWIENQNSLTDPKPEQIQLSPGTYTIWAQSDKNGFVQRPVIIKPSQATEVHL